ncbi:MAG: cytochrome b/b6 domain-containing protein [Candidatus Eisenbacteria bacterium]
MGGLVALGVLLAAAARAAPTNDECLMCHQDRSLARTVGSTGDLSVDARTFAGSVHARLACVDCHRAAVDARHPPHLPPVACASCHLKERQALTQGVHRAVAADLEASCRACHGTHDVAPARGRAMCARCHAQESDEYRDSVHGVALAGGDTEASTCQDCHGSAHSTRAHTDSLSSTSRARLAATCARCHADRELMMRRKITIPEAVQLFRNSVHGRSGKENAAHCNDCHESHRLKRASDPASSIYRTNIPATCGKCHSSEAAAYRTGIHGTALRRGVTASPVCTDCHGEHMIRGPHDLDSPVAATHVSETCSRCHEATGIRETYGLPAGRLSTYRDSFHGLAARGGSPVVANCASCHGYHDILPSSDPRSSVSPQRLASTCGRCHPGAGTKYRMGPVHVAVATPTQPVLYWARWLYLWLIVGTIGFMTLHNGLDFARKLGRHLQEQMGRAEMHVHDARRWYQRMSLVERIQHGLLAGSFFTLVYTGFALKFPEAWPFAWFARLESGYAWRGIIHRVAAVVMVAVSLFHVGYLATRRGRVLLQDLLPRPQDAVDLFQNLLYLSGLRATPARFERFGYIEKAEYWALIWGTIVMTVTGGILWFENSSLRELPKWAMDLATLVHYYEAWLAFLAIVVWHLYQNIANPDVYPMNWTWLTGRISDTQMQHEHFMQWKREVAEVESVAIETAPTEPPAADAGPAMEPGEKTTPDAPAS